MKKVIFIFFILFLTDFIYSQDNPDSTSFNLKFKKGYKYIVKTKNGIEFLGFITEEKKEFFKLEDRDKNEVIEIRKTEVESAKLYSNQNRYKEDELEKNHHASNYLISSSALLFDPEIIITNDHWLLLESIEVPISNNWALTSDLLTFYPLSVGIKCAYNINEMSYLGGSVFGFGDVFDNSGNSLLMGYGAIAKYTRGNSNNNFTFSYGIIGIRDGLLTTSGQSSYINLNLLSFAYCNRFTKKIAFITELFYFPEIEIGISGLGIKFIGNEKYCWSLGAYTYINNDNNKITFNYNVLTIPYFAWSKNF